MPVVDPATLDGRYIQLVELKGKEATIDNDGQQVVITPVVTVWHISHPVKDGLTGINLDILNDGPSGIHGILMVEITPVGYKLTIAEPVSYKDSLTSDDLTVLLAVDDLLADEDDWYVTTEAGYIDNLDDELKRLTNYNDPFNFSPWQVCWLMRENGWAFGPISWLVPRYCEYDFDDPFQSYAEFRARFGSIEYVLPDGRMLINLFSLPERVSTRGYIWCENPDVPGTFMGLFYDGWNRAYNDSNIWIFGYQMFFDYDGQSSSIQIPRNGWIAIGPPVKDNAEFDLQRYHVYLVGDYSLDCQ